MALYKFLDQRIAGSVVRMVLRRLDSTVIPEVPGNRDYTEYTSWSITNVTDPADTLAPVTPVPDYGADDTPREQLVQAVSDLRTYLALASPTNAQTITAFKLLVRVVLFMLRRSML